LQTGGLLDEIGAALLSILWTNDGMLEDIFTYFGFCISWTVEGTDLTGRMTAMTDCGKCKTYLKFKGLLVSEQFGFQNARCNNKNYQRVNFSKFYIPSKHSALDKIIVKLKGRVIFKPYIPQKRNVSASECTNCVTPLATHITLTCTWIRTDSG
jgi:hypothetical protein